MILKDITDLTALFLIIGRCGVWHVIETDKNGNNVEQIDGDDYLQLPYETEVATLDAFEQAVEDVLSSCFKEGLDEKEWAEFKDEFFKRTNTTVKYFVNEIARGFINGVGIEKQKAITKEYFNKI